MTRSQELFERASKLMPGGVNSPVRASVSYTHLDVYKRQLETLYKTLAFHEAAGQLNKWKESFAGCGLDKILFFLRDNLDSDSFQAVLELSLIHI